MSSGRGRRGGRFSALQRAENSSIRKFARHHHTERYKFQCSSASRKFLNFTALKQSRCLDLEVSVLFSEPKIPQWRDVAHVVRGRQGFSALQRAENSSIGDRADDRCADLRRFQCSSASRKFLNQRGDQIFAPDRFSFSALQRAENSSIRTQPISKTNSSRVSVLFSEPKIPQ